MRLHTRPQRQEQKMQADGWISPASSASQTLPLTHSVLDLFFGEIWEKKKGALKRPAVKSMLSALLRSSECVSKNPTTFRQHIWKRTAGPDVDFTKCWRASVGTKCSHSSSIPTDQKASTPHLEEEPMWGKKTVETTAKKRRQRKVVQMGGSARLV